MNRCPNCGATEEYHESRGGWGPPPWDPPEAWCDHCGYFAHGNDIVEHGDINLKMCKQILSPRAAQVFSETVSVLYLDDDSDYLSTLWKIVEILGGNEAVDLLETDKHAAYVKYVESGVSD
jgi:hypothetical protein